MAEEKKSIEISYKDLESADTFGVYSGRYGAIINLIIIVDP